MVNLIENIDKANSLVKKIGGEFIAVTMEIADSYLNNLMPELRKSKIYRQEIKRLIKHCCYNKEKKGLHDMTEAKPPCFSVS